MSARVASGSLEHPPRGTALTSVSLDGAIFSPDKRQNQELKLSWSLNIC